MGFTINQYEDYHIVLETFTTVKMYICTYIHLHLSILIETVDGPTTNQGWRRELVYEVDVALSNFCFRLVGYLAFVVI